MVRPKKGSAALRWPVGRIPVEIFELIISFLSRAEVKTLRLVCSEFETKVSAQYFRNVVVPFRAELYSSHADAHGTAVKPAVFSNGMRIFQSFGPHILRFALSLEIDEDALACPPLKTVHKAVPSFWGIYRWPHEDYRRYQDLERIERTADETDDMKRALRCLSKVRSLGLCCDAGLGFLCGPDMVARTSARRHPVFGPRDWAPRRAPSDAASRTVVSLPRPAANDPAESALARAATVKDMTLTKMVADAGYAGPDQITEAIRLMLLTEGTTASKIDLDGRSRPVGDLERNPASLFGQPPSLHSTCPLIPCDLTMAQMEMLLELEWAHRAMIQSYVIGLIDNASSGCFNNVTTLTIAKIPSSHLHILCRDDLWDSIPGLTTVSLGVIADWRRISVSSPGFVEDKAVSPVEAVGKAFSLLNAYIGKRTNIKSIHFEWICGGELAPGLHHRNKHILPAPLFELPDLMATPTGLVDHADELLGLPHATRLSLKNCWISPHVLLHTIRQMALASLEKIELESVSLSGPPTLVRQASIIPLLRRQPRPQGHIVQVMATDMMQDALPDWMGLGPTLLQPMPNATADDAAEDAQPAMRQPDLMSWPGIIEHLSPGVTIRQLLAQGDAGSSDGAAPAPAGLDALSAFLPDFARLPSEQERSHLSSLSFKSCGYVAVDLPYLDSRSVLPTNAATLPAMVNKTDRPNLSRFMQRCHDKMMGLIVPYIKPQDRANLESGFGMVMGWHGIYEESVIDDAIADGMEHPGLGRFSGVVKSNCDD